MSDVEPQPLRAAQSGLPVSLPSSSVKPRPVGSSRAPLVVIDRREQDPLPFSRLKTRPGTLATGDYSILGTEELFAVERKTLPDLVACCAGERERFSRELHRLRGYRFKRLVVIGSEAEILAGQYRSLVSPRAALATLYCFEVRFDLPFVFCADALQAGRLIERWALWFARELYKNANGLLLGAGEIRNARSSKIGRSNKHETDQYRHIDMLLP